MYTRQQLTIVLQLALGALLLLTVGVSCAPTAPAKPTVVIAAPPSGTRTTAGSEVEVQSVATDAQGIARVELWVDGNLVANSPLLSPQTTYNVVQRWTATTPGAHTLQVRAYNASGAASDPTAISIEVIAALAQATQPPPAAQPTAPLPPPTQVQPTAPRTAPTSPPTKPPPSPVPTRVPPAPTAPPTAPPPPACPGAPVLGTFTANPATITAGQSTTLSWGKVENATNVSIDQGIGGVATPDSRTVSPATTTTYTLTATGCGGTVTKQVKVTVNPAPTTVTLILTGQWDSPEWGATTLLHNTNNNQVVGVYTWDDGMLDGLFNPSNRRWDFKWWEKARGKTYYDAQVNERGVGYVIVSPDGKAMTGKWRYESSSDWNGNWTATRK